MVIQMSMVWNSLRDRLLGKMWNRERTEFLRAVNSASRISINLSAKNWFNNKRTLWLPSPTHAFSKILHSQECENTNGEFSAASLHFKARARAETSLVSPTSSIPSSWSSIRYTWHRIVEKNLRFLVSCLDPSRLGLHGEEARIFY